MESLSARCTPLKREYDSCFNAWFEGYLQPALQTGHPVYESGPSSSPSPSTSVVDNESQESHRASSVHRAGPSVPGPAGTADRKMNPLNWSSAIGAANRKVHQESRTADAYHPPQHDNDDSESRPIFVSIDPKGKTRAQVKALQYERACGQVWQQYRACLQAAIEENQGLATLLEQARNDHPLTDLESLKGTIWDEETRPST
ncbi:hypothetical protein BD324DRAFT_625140 [Kockovaella imperatae]|uniref:Uncharacterized protein n=1 Tax=Kockovaella imperatae TaxID=4999 RepID=A0A1Y1UGP3_9TREE|nr:hypothetical protein BD324DRAFT_625140 [Kockovaella imperatae]ORX37198.1 hypothetical protein BD324DRAFT_625140 [Kockovaella imperatae]